MIGLKNVMIINFIEYCPCEQTNTSECSNDTFSYKIINIYIYLSIKTIHFFNSLKKTLLLLLQHH